MKKSLLTGIAVCAALAVFAGNSYAASRSSVPTAKPQEQAAPLPAQVQDCIHATFPQCGGND
jgi:hypothetical protein